MAQALIQRDLVSINKQVYNAYMIGKNEELVLLAALEAGDRSPAARIYQVLGTAIGSGAPPFGALYTTLDRMAAKGWLSVLSIEDRNQRARKHFSVTAEGRSALMAGLNAASALGAGHIVGVAYGNG